MHASEWFLFSCFRALLSVVLSNNQEMLTVRTDWLFYHTVVTLVAWLILYKNFVKTTREVCTVSLLFPPLFLTT